HARDLADDELARVACDAADRHRVDLRVRDRARALDALGERAETRAEHERELDALDAVLAQARREPLDLAARCRRSAHASRNRPAIVAVIQHANAPPTIARKASLARSVLRSGTSAEMPPIWMPIDAKLAKPHNA